MKNLIVIMLFFLLGNSCSSQSVTRYPYISNETIGVNEASTPTFDIGGAFTTQRKYYSPFVFSETRLFTGDDKKSIVYKVENDIWYYKKKSKWHLFYNYNKRDGGEISLFGLSYIIRFEKTVSIRNMLLHKIVVLPANISQSHLLSYYFSPIKGVLIIRSSNGAVLLRSDNFTQPLTESEIALL